LGATGAARSTTVWNYLAYVRHVVGKGASWS
jgi:hypothetical protein